MVWYVLKQDLDLTKNLMEYGFYQTIQKMDWFNNFFRFCVNILNIEITLNRGDCLIILGIAREIVIGINKKIKLPEIKVYPITQSEKYLEILSETNSLIKYSALLLII